MLKQTTAKSRRAFWSAAWLVPAAWCAALPTAAAPSAMPAKCVAQSGAQAATVVELYTSEGCDSCPPADKWLARLNRQPGVVALAFHVDYWDGLGWRDRFASPLNSQRQRQQQSVNGAKFAYTPQVVVNGRDQPGWARWQVDSASQSAQPSTVEVTIWREDDHALASVTALDGAPQRLSAAWLFTESGHRSEVHAGENRGATLDHDAVVRSESPIASWQAQRNKAVHLRTEWPAATPGAAIRQLNLVVFNADTGRPVQALKLGC